MSSDSSQGLIACSSVLMGLSTLAVGLRFYARKQQKARFLTDDWIVLPALLTYIGATATILLAVQTKYLGYPAKSFTEAEQAAMSEPSHKLQIAFDVLIATSLACVKLSAVFFYRRVFCVGGPSKWFHHLTLATAVVIVCWLVAFQFLAGFQCGTHFSAMWDGTYLKYCTISFPFLYGLTISDFLLDVWILAIPIPLIWRLHATPAKKLSILGIFLLAFVGLGACIARMVVLIQDVLGGPTYFVTHDQELIISSYFFYSMLENGMALVAVNLPSLWLLCTSVIPDRVVRSIRSVMSLSSMRSADQNTAPAHPERKPSLAVSSEPGEIEA